MLSVSAAPNRRLAALPPPDHVHAKANSSSAVILSWSRPAFSSGKPLSYSVRCGPVSPSDVSGVRYVQTWVSISPHLCVVCLQLNHFIPSLIRTEQTVTLTGLQPNTRYEFAVRLHMDHMSSPWSVTVYQKTSLEGNESARVCDIRWEIRQKLHAGVCSAPQLRPLLRWMWKCLWSMTVQRWCRGDHRISPTCLWLITPSCTPHRAHGSLGNGRFCREKVLRSLISC